MMDWTPLDSLPHYAISAPEGDVLWQLVLRCRRIEIPLSVQAWKKALDAGSAASAPTLFLNPPARDRDELTEVYGFPPLALAAIPGDDLLDEALRSTFGELKEGSGGLYRQSRIAESIATRVAAALPDVVALLVYDGLSYREGAAWGLPDHWRARMDPVFADGLTVTERGMHRVIGDPPLAHRLFSMGYRERLGFAYWERGANSLARELFAEFPERQMYRVADFSEVLDRLLKADLSSPTYVQVIRTGLDHVSHIHRERPNVERLLHDMNNDLVELGRALLQTTRNVLFFVTSDHGILWYNDQQTIPFDPLGQHPRYIEGSASSQAEHVVFRDGSQIFTALADGQVLARARRKTEWGFHGGVSAQESIVPLIELRPA